MIHGPCFPGKKQVSPLWGAAQLGTQQWSPFYTPRQTMGKTHMMSMISGHNPSKRTKTWTAAKHKGEKKTH